MPVETSVLQAALSPEGTLDRLSPDFERLGSRYEGKVRENFTRGDERIIVVTDRVSAFDVIIGTIPFKGQVLNTVATHWFSRTADMFPNHLLEVIDPQAVRVVQCDPLPVEFVVRGYLTGRGSTSIWTAYSKGERIFCGHALPEGLREYERLPTNLLTPSTKAPKGDHDQSVSKDELFARGLIDREEFEALEPAILSLFAFGQAEAAKRGLILVDTKYEIGRAPDGRLLLIDEIHTPDSSRYWYADSYEQTLSQGADPRSLDKEYVRRWLLSVGFSGEGTPPVLPDEIRMEAARRYVEICEVVTGKPFVPDVEPPLTRLARNLNVR